MTEQACGTAPESLIALLEQIKSCGYESEAGQLESNVKFQELERKLRKIDAESRTLEQLGFDAAISLLKEGHRVTRAGWNGKGMWLLQVKAVPWGEFIGKKELWATCPENADYLPWIGMKTADNKFVPWLASQTDLLADDWMVLADCENPSTEDKVSENAGSVSVCGVQTDCCDTGKPIEHLG